MSAINKSAARPVYNVLCDCGNGDLITFGFPSEGLFDSHEIELIMAAAQWKEGDKPLSVHKTFTKMFAVLLYNWLGEDFLPEIKDDAAKPILALAFDNWKLDEKAEAIEATEEFQEHFEYMKKACTAAK